MQLTNALSYLFLFLYAVAAVLNLIGTRKGHEKLFAVTKPMLLLLLCLFCFCRTYPTPGMLLIGAFFTCWIGDVLLMLKGEGFFTVGGIAFLGGHILLILIFARQADIFISPLYVLIPAVAVYIAASVFVILRTRKGAPPLMLIALLLYLLCNAAMNLFALSRIFVSPGIWSVLSYVGAVLFFISDCALFLIKYDDGRARFYKTDFFVMLTYISGVLLIALGLVQL